jgi:hypothetical protein
MSPLFVIGIPPTLTVIGIVWNSLYIVHDQPQYSLEQEPANKLAAERT